MEIILQNTCLSNENKMFLQDLNYTFEEGALTVLLGQSDSGKTLLLKALAALVLPSSGSIMIGNFVIDAKMYTKFNTLRNHIGFLFEDFEDQFIKKTVKEELLFCLSLHPFKGDKIKKIKEVLDLLELSSSFLNMPIESLSFLDKKKVAFASILIYQPDMILLDEPFLALTPSDQKDFIKLFYRLTKKEGKTIILATQNSELALKVADQVVLLGKGKIRLLGDKYAVLSDTACLHRYGMDEPKLIRFARLVQREKGIKMGYRDEINDLMKDVFRYVR